MKDEAGADGECLVSAGAPEPFKPRSAVHLFLKQQQVMVHRSDLGSHPVPPLLGSVILARYLTSLSLDFLIDKMGIILG